MIGVFRFEIGFSSGRAQRGLGIRTKEFVLWTYAQPVQKNDKKLFYFFIIMKFMFLTVDVGEEREIKRELFELSGLAEKPGQKLP